MGWHRIRMWGWVVWGVCLAGCSASDRIQEPKNTIHYYQFSLPRDRAGLTSLLDRFHLDHPDIRVQLHTLPTSSDDQHQFYLTHATGEGTSRIDVLAVDVIWLAEFARAGLLLPVDDLFEASQWRQFFGSSVQAATYEGVRYAVPFFIDGGLLYSRKDLLEKHGYDAPPRTFPELVRMARTILDREDDPDL
ncbi:MAG: extracellular solute-binding protein, partial [Nitrospinaceae bacterium]|nr:extracellular solute-binding protein [Nitrospinaceae bacterium]